MSKQYVPIGARVVIKGKNYECIGIKKGSRSFDCSGCDLFDNDGCHKVSCIGTFRKDGQWVIFKEVKAMKMGIEVPVGGVIVAYGSEMVCVEDYTDKNGVRISCRACPIKDNYPCEHLACGRVVRSDGKSTHFEYYYGVKK